MAENKHSGSDDIKLTAEEVHKLTAAFQDKNFLKLFQDYVEDVNSKESREKYEKEIILLEKDRGYDVKFIHPVPSYVIKFISSEKKTFVNICQNQYAGKAVPEKKDCGTQWKIPVILSKPRDDLDKKGCKCKVYDVMFHPETIELAFKDSRFKSIVEDTASSMISDNFGAKLDLKTAKFPKLKYKGKTPHVVLRKKIGTNDTNISCEPLEEYYKKHIGLNAVQAEEPVKHLSARTPQYIVKHRDIVDMKDFSLMGYTDKCAPKEIIVEIMLPDLQKVNDVILDVFERKLVLKSCENMNHRYQLNLDLSYAVNSYEGKATFDKSNNKLTVQLPLKDRGIPIHFDESGDEVK